MEYSYIIDEKDLEMVLLKAKEERVNLTKKEDFRKDKHSSLPWLLMPIMNGKKIVLSFSSDLKDAFLKANEARSQYLKKMEKAKKEFRRGNLMAFFGAIVVLLCLAVSFFAISLGMNKGAIYYALFVCSAALLALTVYLIRIGGEAHAKGREYARNAKLFLK